jgi:hypothetical protein
MMQGRMSGSRSRLLIFGVLLVVLIVLAFLPAKRRGPVDGFDSPSLDLFPSGYDASRLRFGSACARAVKAHAGDCRGFPVDSATEPDLTIETGYVTAGNNRLLVLQSGIHGVEAYAGSAIQVRLLEHHLDRLLEAGFDILLVHALNPYGFRHNLRTDEINVNLNRNFATDPTMFRHDNHDYEALRWVFEPEGPVESARRGSLRAKLGLVWAFAAAGFDAKPIREAMNTGQYRFPDGLGYGGRSYRPQTAFLRGHVASIMAAHPGGTLYLDVHTGLGKAGALHIIVGAHPAARPRDRLASVIQNLRGAGITLTSAADPGFYRTSGDVIDFVPSLAADPDRVLAVTLEFGTVGTGIVADLTTASRLILENQARLHGCVSASVCATVNAAFREQFNPHDPWWRASVLREADALLMAVARDF